MRQNVAQIALVLGAAAQAFIDDAMHGGILADLMHLDLAGIGRGGNEVAGRLVDAQHGAGDAALLNFDSSTGAVTLKSSADHESKSSYNFTVLATNGSLVTEQAVTVSVSDFSSTATTGLVTDAAQSDLVAGTNGNIVLVAGGTVTLNDGTVNGGAAGAAGGTGAAAPRARA